MEIGRPYSRLLQRLEKLITLSAQDRQLIAELPLTVSNFSSNDQVARYGEAPTRCTLVLGGYLYGHKRVRGSRRQITSFFVPGDIADLHTLHLAPLDHSLSTLGPAVVAFMPHAAFRDMLTRSPQLAEAFWRDTFIRLAILREWVTNLGRRDALAKSRARDLRTGAAAKSRRPRQRFVLLNSMDPNRPCRRLWYFQRACQPGCAGVAAARPGRMGFPEGADSRLGCPGQDW